MEIDGEISTMFPAAQLHTKSSILHRRLLEFIAIYPLVMTNIAMYRWPIEIDDFPSYKPPFILGFSMAMLNNQMVIDIY